MEHFRDWTQKADPQAHDVVLSRRCNPGTTAYVPPGLRFAVGQNLVLLRSTGRRVHPPFLRWWVSGPDWWNEVGKFINVGAVFDSLRCRDVPKFELPLPPLAEQRRIAATLGALDDKIELNRKMNRTLEEVAQAIFKSWFIDFDGHDSFVDSEIGPVPKKWEVSTLGDPLELKRGYDLPKKQRCAGSTPIISSSGPSVWHNEAKVAGPGVVAGRYGTIGKVFYVEGDFWPLNTSLYVRDFKGGPARWAFHLLRTVNWSAYTGKSAVPGVNRNHVHKERVVRPPLAERWRFADMVGPLWNLHSTNNRESATLAELRDTLLPKLISGELRVPEAVQRVEAAS